MVSINILPLKYTYIRINILYDKFERKTNQHTNRFNSVVYTHTLSSYGEFYTTIIPNCKQSLR